MGDEAQKRTTDCVYFLASPLTCKKGNECEYRHSESARINPRDCWYWLSGNCLNANCTFRHPPLDGRPGASTPSTAPSIAVTSAAAMTAAASSLASSSSTASVAAPTSKSTVPCFFFSQGYCAKGGKCPFLHGPPTHFRKEATTYRKPQTSEQAANGEGNGFSHVKQQPQDSKPASQMRLPVKAGTFSQESGYTPSNVYKLSAQGGPTGSSVPPSRHTAVLLGEKADQNSHMAPLKPSHHAKDSSTRHGQLVESRISQAYLGDECMQQATPGVGIKVQSLQLDLSRKFQKPQTSAAYNFRISEDFFNSELQDPMFDTDAQHGARELHAGDLRNHLKRKKGDTVYVNHLKNFYGKEYPKERLESGRLASRAVAVVESKDFAPNNIKRAKEDKENFSGPKSLAQIKAEKSKVSSEVRNEGQDMITPDFEVKRKVQLASELHFSPSTEFELEKTEVPLPSTFEDFLPSSGKSLVLKSSIGIDGSNGISSYLVPLREVVTASFLSSEDLVKHDGLKLDTNSNPMALGKEGKHDLSSVGILKSGTHSHNSRECPAASSKETGYMSAEGLMEDGTEALENIVDTVYASDYDEEDDFARKLGRFLS